MVDGINNHTRFIVDLRRHMWMSGIEVELRRLIWQIAVVGKYISAKIHESNRKLAGFKNVYGEDQLALDRISDDILKNMLRNSGFVREYASEEQEDIITIGQGQEQYIVTADPVDGSSPGGYQSGHRDDHRHPQKFNIRLRQKIRWSPLFYITYGPLITMIYSAGKGVHEFVIGSRRRVCPVRGEYQAQ